MDEIDDLIDSYDGSPRSRRSILEKVRQIDASELRAVEDALDERDEEAEEQHQCAECGYSMRNCLCIQFADPGGNSALRAATPTNPRNLPCPTCGGENLLTPADVVQGYQCDHCADMAERGGY